MHVFAEIRFPWKREVPQNNERFSAIFTVSCTMISLIVSDYNLRGMSRIRKIHSESGKVGEKSFYFGKSRHRIFFEDSFPLRLTLNTTSSTIASPSRHHLYHPMLLHFVIIFIILCKIMSSYESAKEVYELLQASTKVLMNGNVSRQSQKHRAIFRRIITPNL